MTDSSELEKEEEHKKPIDASQSYYSNWMKLPFSSNQLFNEQLSMSEIDDGLR